MPLPRALRARRRLIAAIPLTLVLSSLLAGQAPAALAGSGACVITNRAASAAVLARTAARPLSVSDTDVLSNLAVVDGGGLYMLADLTIEGAAAVASNEAGNNSGGVWFGRAGDLRGTLRMKDTASVRDN